MDTMEVNKAVAAVLVAGIAFFVTGTIGMALVSEHFPKETAIKIEGAPAAGSGPAAPAEPELPAIAPFLAKADVSAGEAVAKKVCAACHTFGQGQPAGVGPNLYGVVGAPHGHMAGFNYSEALKSIKGPWTYEELNHWLFKPSLVAPGTRMSFAGIKSEKERADVIAYLRSLSANPEPLPSPDAAAPPNGAAATGASSPTPAPAAPGSAAPPSAPAPAAKSP